MRVLLGMRSVNNNGEKVGGNWGVQGPQCKSVLDEGDREEWKVG